MFNYVARRLRKARPELEVTLTTQYRMVSGIGELISHCFYDGKLQHGRLELDAEGRDARAHRACHAHVRLVDVPGQESETKSRYNLAEVASVMTELQRLNVAAKHKAGAEPLKVAVITGYGAQLARLDSALAKRTFDGLKIRIGSVDRFQGDEEEVVIFSAVRTAMPGFLRDRPRINVAFSRARSLLIVCAHVERARSGRLGGPLQDVVGYIDERLATGDDRYVLARCDEQSR